MLELSEYAAVDADLHWKRANLVPTADVQVVRKRELPKTRDTVCEVDFVPQIPGVAGPKTARHPAIGKADTGDRRPEGEPQRSAKQN